MLHASQAVGRDGKGMNIKCAIFDFDGTLFDSMFIWDEIGERYLRSLGKEPNPSMREAVRTLSLYQAACYLRREYDLPLSTEEIMKGINQMIEHFYLSEILPKPGVCEFLEHMKKAGISMCIATASERYQIEAALKRCGMSQYFDAIFTCSEIGHGKEEPFIFRQAMEVCGAERNTTVVFEDAFHAALTARRDGFSVIAVYDESEKYQEEIRRLADCYLVDFVHTKDFWEFISG